MRRNTWTIAWLGSMTIFAACAVESPSPEQVTGAESALGSAPPLTVLPAFLVASGQPQPDATAKKRLMDHVLKARDEYKRMLGGRTTFTVTGTTPAVIGDSSHTAADYQQALQKASDGYPRNPGILLDPFFLNYGFDRFSNKYVYVIVPLGVVADSKGVGTGGQSINGGINSGGGLVVLLANDLAAANVQSTLQHELGHAFGLNHSYEENGYNGYLGGPAPPTPPPSNLAEPPECAVKMNPCQAHAPIQCRFSANQGWTIMSQNACHWTSELTPSATPGELLPEDINRLALNRGAFPALVFDPERDKAASYPLQEPLVHFGPLRMVGHPSPIPTVVSSFGEDYGTHVTNVVDKTIRKSNAKTGWDPATMWQSASVNESGWANLVVTFPKAVTLDRVEVHTQHSGLYHAADVFQIRVGSPATFVASQNVAIDDSLSFAATTGSQWTFELHSNSSAVVVRGLRFFKGANELYPHAVPLEQNILPDVTTSSGSILGSKPMYTVVDTVLPDDAATGFVPTRMWHSDNVGVNGWASLDVTFPYPVTVDAVTVNSRHSGQYHAATEIRVSYFDKALNFFNLIADFPTFGVPNYMGTIPKRASTRWRLEFQTSSGYVTIRGIRFRTPVATGWAERPDCIVGP